MRKLVARLNDSPAGQFLPNWLLHVGVEDTCYWKHHAQALNQVE
jgi:hypothetical protein